jgi:CRISPR-associated protein (TIGR03984 family)
MTASGEMKANHLLLLKICSTCSRPEQIDQQGLEAQLSVEFPEKTLFVAWLDNRVEIGLYADSRFHFYEQEEFQLCHVQRLRVFNEHKELHVWRNSGQWLARLRTDGSGKEQDVMRAHQLLFGSKRGNGQKGEIPGFTTITEDRGTTLHLPLNNLRFDDKGNLLERVFITSHNYIQANGTGQAGYVDCRFVGLSDGRNLYSLV